MSGHRRLEPEGAPEPEPLVAFDLGAPEIQRPILIWMVEAKDWVFVLQRRDPMAGLPRPPPVQA